MPRIVILGWGSLIWDLGSLADYARGSWRLGGPQLPIEFSRISWKRHGALTLVINPEHGDDFPTQFIESSRTDPGDVACDLRTREGTVIRYIGLIDIRSGFVRSKSPYVSETIRHWAQDQGLDAVVWTDLPSNYDDVKGEPFSVPNAMTYLKGLTGEAADEARKYINNAPEVDTPLRRELRKDGWLSPSH